MANPERTVYSFPGTPWVYLVAICHDCGERVAFAGPSASRARDDWMSSHTNGNPAHQITIEREEMSGMPVEPSEPFAVVAFIKVREDDQQPLNYAAIRNGDRWVLTQDSRSNYPQRSRGWDELMRWIGPDEWPTVRVLAEKRDNPVSSDQIVNYHVNGHVSDIDGWLSKRDNQLRSQQL